MKQLINSVVGASALNKTEMKHVVAGRFGGPGTRQDHIGDLSACNNKTCISRNDCGSGFCASMTCKGLREQHCM